MKTNYCTKRSPFTIVCLVFISLYIPRFPVAQTKDTIENNLKAQPTDTTNGLSPLKKQISEVVKTLVANKQYHNLSYTERKIKYRITKDAELFKLPGGESRAALFKLPDYDADYFLIIRSLIYGISFIDHIFSPTGIFLDSLFRPIHLLPEKQFLPSNLSEGGGLGLRASVYLEAQVVMDIHRKDDRYLLIYTLNNNERIGTYNSTQEGVIMNLFNQKVVRSQEGRLEVELHLR